MAPRAWIASTWCKFEPRFQMLWMYLCQVLLEFERNPSILLLFAMWSEGSVAGQGSQQ